MLCLVFILGGPLIVAFSPCLFSFSFHLFQQVRVEDLACGDERPGTLCLGDGAFTVFFDLSFLLFFVLQRRLNNKPKTAPFSPTKAILLSIHFYYAPHSPFFFLPERVASYPSLRLFYFPPFPVSLSGILGKIPYRMTTF